MLNQNKFQTGALRIRDYAERPNCRCHVIPSTSRSLCGAKRKQNNFRKAGSPFPKRRTPAKSFTRRRKCKCVHKAANQYYCLSNFSRGIGPVFVSSFTRPGEIPAVFFPVYLSSGRPRGRRVFPPDSDKDFPDSWGIDCM